MRTRPSSTWLLAGLALLATAWWEAGRLPLAGAVSSPGRAEAGLSGEEARQLCLASSPSDDSTRDAGSQASKVPDRPEDWVRVGWSWVRRARVSGDAGFYVNVSGCTAEALRIAPGHTAALELLALVRMNGHEFAEAAREAEGILAADPQNPVALGILSDALLELGRFEEAAAAAQRGADVQPDSASYARASWFRWLTGDKEGAKRFVRLALEGRDRRDPEPTAWAFVEAARIFWHEADYEGADLVLEEALRWVPDYPPALVVRGRVALSRGQADRAISNLEKAFRAQPLAETAWLLADAREAAGDAAGAEVARARVEQIGSRSDRLTLALFYATHDRSTDRALQLIDEERAGRGGVYVEDTYAWVLYRAGRIEEALQASERAMRLATPDARILFHAGAIRIAAGLPEGRALVEKALAINPAFDRTGAAEARRLVEQTQAGTDTVGRDDS